MPRARMLKPGFFKNEELASLPFEDRLCYAGLWTIADRDGRLVDKPKRIKAEIFPYDNIDVDALLNDLQRSQFIRRYVVNGTAVIAIPTFNVHQHPHPKEPDSELPAPPKKVGGRTATSNGPTSDSSASDHRPDSVEPVADPSESCTSESLSSESCTSGSSGSSESESDHPSAPLRGASPLKGASPLRGSRRLKRNLAASRRAADHIRARGAK
jgi:hypothetical protein